MEASEMSTAIDWTLEDVLAYEAPVDHLGDYDTT